MKRMFMCVWILFFLSAIAQSQAKSNQTTKQTSKSTQSAIKKKASSNSSNVTTLNSSSAYPAKINLNAASIAENTYTVSDPIIRALDARANGADIKINKSGIVGMPKRAYGFANGHLVLKTTGAVTTGTQTGSGAVATGTSQGTFGSNGPAMEVNGKNPYAGTIMWGNVLNMYLPRPETSAGRNPKK